MNEQNIFSKMVATFGEKNQILKTAEECNELAHALIKYAIIEGKPIYDPRILKEIADVEVMLIQLKTMMMEDEDNNCITKYSHVKERVLFDLNKKLEDEQKRQGLLNQRTSENIKKIGERIWTPKALKSR